MIVTSQVRPVLRSAAVALVVAAALSACSGDDGEGSTEDTAKPTPTATTSPSPTSTEEADEAAALAVFEQYWDVYVAALDGADPDQTPFLELATDEVIAQDTATAQTYADAGIEMSGEPVLSDLKATLVEPDVVHVTSCVDDGDWVGMIDGEPLPKPSDVPEVHPVVYQVIRGAEGWLVGPTVDAGADVKC